jgi:hypothetical protein
MTATVGTLGASWLGYWLDIRPTSLGTMGVLGKSAKFIVSKLMPQHEVPFCATANG